MLVACHSYCKAINLQTQYNSFQPQIIPPNTPPHLFYSHLHPRLASFPSLSLSFFLPHSQSITSPFSFFGLIESSFLFPISRREKQKWNLSQYCVWSHFFLFNLIFQCHPYGSETPFLDLYALDLKNNNIIFYTCVFILWNLMLMYIRA